jgi:hypothetical protein
MSAESHIPSAPIAFIAIRVVEPIGGRLNNSLIGGRLAGPRRNPSAAASRRVISDCHFAVQLNHFIPGFLSYSVPVFLK